MLYRDDLPAFLQTVALLSVPFGKSKISQGSESEKFSEGKQHSTAKRLIFRKLISINTFDNLAKSYMFHSNTYDFLYFRKSRLTA